MTAFDEDCLRAAASAGSGNLDTLDLLTACLHGILGQHGLGYRDTTYRGLLFAELSHRGIRCVRDPVAPVHASGGLLGESKLPCLVFPDRCALFITALRDSRQAADLAMLQTFLKHLGLPWGLHLNFGKERLVGQFVVKPSRTTP
jgi:hypothetical protein